MTITAREARKLATTVDDNLRQRIYESIKAVAQDKKTYLFWYKEEIPESMRSELTDAGYNVETLTDEGETFFKISW